MKPHSMFIQDTQIQRKLMRAILLTSGAVLLISCSIYLAYEYYTFRQSSIRQLTTLGRIIATNSTAALVFQNRDEAFEILSALKAEPRIEAAALYDKGGKLFVFYPSELQPSNFPESVKDMDYIFQQSSLSGFQSVILGDKNIGSLFLKANMLPMYERIQLYIFIVILIIIMSGILSYVLSKNLQRGISRPVLALTETAKAISIRKDYSVRADKLEDDEFGLLTDAFNQMLAVIHNQNNEILSFNHKLEQNIVDRTKELEVTNKELEAFSYSVSHDLRAPLRSIDGYSRILIEDYDKKLDEEGKRILQIIVRNAVRMGHLIDDLLAFSRIGKLSLTKSNLSFDVIVSHAVDELKNNYSNAVEVDIKPLLPAYGDSSMLKQVMTNLIGNALKYSMKRERSIVEIGSYAEDHNHVYYVKDNGAGFDMKYYDKLFGVFQRLHSSAEFEGTGVGLALVQRIIHKHGGKVWAEGKVGQGATFYFSLPGAEQEL